MADLPELAEWVEGIYQIEQTDPVLGGAPNETTGAGLSNIPSLQLAKRTRWLKQMMENAGISVETMAITSNFDTITQGGLYVGSGATVGAPDASTGSVLLHIPSNSGNAAIQLAFRIGAVNRAWLRRKQAGAWASWVEIMTGSNVQETATDSNTGRLLSVGAFGLGSDAPSLITNLNDATLRTGWYRTRPEDTVSGLFPGGAVGSGRVGVLQVSRVDGDRVIQQWRPITSNQIWERRYFGSAWLPWRRLWDGENIDQSFGVNGYQRMPSGLIMQWGQVAASGALADETMSVVFPIPFPNACFQAFGHDPNDVLAATQYQVSAHAWTTTGMSLSYHRTGGVSNITTINWFALGN